MRILIIDDNVEACDTMSVFLNAEGFQVSVAHTGADGLQTMRRVKPDLVILDILLPGMDGREVGQRIRSASDVPILMMSAFAQQAEDVVQGLALGGDDYIFKPIDFDILKARVLALLRRSTGLNGHSRRRAYVDSYLVVDLDNEQVSVQGQHVSLSPLEYHLLEVLVINAGQAVPALEIIEELWPGADGDEHAGSLHTYVSRLRKIVEPNPQNPQYIVTEHGFGYRFIPQ